MMHCTVSLLLLYSSMVDVTAQSRSGGPTDRPLTAIEPVVYWETEPTVLSATESGEAELNFVSVRKSQSFLPGVRLDLPPRLDVQLSTQLADFVATTLRQSTQFALYRTEPTDADDGATSQSLDSFAAENPNVVEIYRRVAADGSTDCQPSYYPREAARLDVSKGQSQSVVGASRCPPIRKIVRQVDFPALNTTNEISFIQDLAERSLSQNASNGLWKILRTPNAEQMTVFDPGLEEQQNPSRASGPVRLGYWILRPTVLRAGDRSRMNIELLTSLVNEVNYSDVLLDFWSAGSLVENPNWGRSRWQEEARSSLLEVDVNPVGPWTSDTPVQVLSVALQRGEAPHREWLLVSYAPNRRGQTVSVRIPEYAEVLIDTDQNGTLHHIVEQSLAVTRLSRTEVNEATDQRIEGFIEAPSEYSTYANISPRPLQILAPRSPAAYWKLDEPGNSPAEMLVDATGNGNDAISSVWGTSSTAGRIDGARRFAGGYATAPITPALQSASFSLSAWVSAQSYPSSGRLAVIYSTFAPDASGWVVGLSDDGRIVVSVGDGLHAPWLLSSKHLTVGEWKHIAVTFNATTGIATIYIDGLQDMKGTFTGSRSSTTSPIATIGRASWTGSYYFTGALDEISVFPAVLDSAEVAADAAPSMPTPDQTQDVVVRTTEEFRSVIALGVDPGVVIKVAPGDYIGPFPSRSHERALHGTSEQPIVITALDPSSRPTIHWRNSWLGPLKYVAFRDLDFTGRINIDGAVNPSGRRNIGVSFDGIRWSLCGWGGQAECLKVTKGDAMSIERVTFFAVQAYRAGLARLTPEDRSRMSPYTLAQIDSSLANDQNMGRATDMPIDFVAVNDSVIRSVSMETCGSHACIQIKGGSSRNLVENNVLSGWAIPHFRLVSRTINLAGGTNDAFFREEGHRQFEAYDTIVRGNRIECGDACGAIATQIGTEWSNNTHSMIAGQGNCVSPSIEPGSRWAMRLTTEASSDHVDEVRPSQDAVLARNVWVYKKCASSAEFVNRSKLCAEDVDLNLPGQDCVAHKTINWRENVVYELDWDASIDREVNPWDANQRVRHCHATVSQVAQDWDSGSGVGLGDVSGQCIGRQGENGVDPQLVDAGMPSMRILEPEYTDRGIGANALFPWGVAPQVGVK